MSSLVNIASYIPEVAAKQPFARAIVIPGPRTPERRRTYSHLTFAGLEGETNRLARGLSELGFSRSMRTLVMVKPSIEFFCVTFALFKLGAVPVLIDPGMGRQGLLTSITKVEPEGMIGIPQAHMARMVFPKAFRSVRKAVTVGAKWGWSGFTYDQARSSDESVFPLADTRADELAAILFTSGSTGPAKGVEYTHGIFDTQTRMIRDTLGIEPGEIDLPAFPLFALFSAALGVTCVIPDMDASHPARVEPDKIIEAILDHGVTYSFGSPAFWKRVVGECQRRGVRFPSLRRVLVAGAPVPPELLRRFGSVFDGEVHIPYGATEALPVAWSSGSRVLSETAEMTAQGAGTCVGRPAQENEVRIIRITDDPIDTFDRVEFLPAGEIGEILVRGPTVTSAYFRDDRATRASKILDGATIWHRMGDVGYLDASGRLWFCGRKSHRVETASGPRFSKLEAILEQHPRVYRAALVGVGARGREKPVMVVECEVDARPKSKADELELTRELLDLARAHPELGELETILFHPSLPVDVRHNAKIKRELLKPWAESKLGVSA